MQRLTLLSLALMSSTFASPLIKRSVCSAVPPGPFRLVAVNNAATYPLVATFPAEYNRALHFYASTSTPYVNTTDFDYVGPSLEALQTSHVPNYPGGPAETFDSVSPAAGSPLQMQDTAPTSGHLTYICPSGSPSYFTIDDSGDGQWSLCVGSATDPYIGRRLLYWKGTDPSCESVSLRVA